MFQREGQPWQRVSPGSPFLDLGPSGQFDDLLVYPTHNAPIRVGERLYIFYTGGSAHRLDMSMGVMWIGRDRFVGMAHSRREPGELITKPVTLEHARIAVNAVRLHKGVVRLGLRHSNGDWIDGYGLQESRIDLSAGSDRTPARWKDKADVSELKGKKVWLHFQVDGASLYAYRFYD